MRRGITRSRKAMSRWRGHESQKYDFLCDTAWHGIASIEASREVGVIGPGVARARLEFRANRPTLALPPSQMENTRQWIEMTSFKNAKTECRDSLAISLMRLDATDERHPM